jgi:putative FmdB family regulatory protein
MEADATVPSYTWPVPTYEFRCRACGRTFTESRPMSRSGDPATCPCGHSDTRRLLDVAGVSRSGAPASAQVSAGPAAGGCCGGGCCG